MANNMTFNTSLRLDSTSFKKGVRDVQRSLTSLKNSFLSLAGALGAGLGFTKLISDLKDTAVQLSVAKNTLENVSRETRTYTDGVNEVTVSISNYNENMAFAKRLADDYSQDLVAITHNFAQFHAACEKTNLDLENQKLVFESLTKAAAYYHMSSDRTKDMMNAVTQMMSKGKVSAEELRRQLGNALPGAFNLMAAALGVSNAQLDDMMRKGEVLASDALPKFAAMLNTVTQNADFDSLQLSMNRLKNTWYELTENVGAEDIFNKIVKGADSTLNYINRNISGIKSSFKGLVVAIGSYKLFSGWIKQGEEFIATTNAQLNNLKTQYTKWINRYNQIVKRGGMNAAQGSINIGKNGVGTGAFNVMDGSALKSLYDYNDTVLKIAKNRRALLVPMTQEWREQNQIVQAAKATNAEIAKTLALTNANVVATSTWKKLYAGMVSAVKAIVTTLKSMGIMAVVSAILGVVTKLVSQAKEVRQEWERINNIVKDHENAIKAVDTSTTSTINQAKSYLRILEDTNKSEYTRLDALKKLNETMGTNFSAEALDKTTDAYKKIVEQVNLWAQGLKLAAKLQVIATRGAEAEAKIQELETGLVKKREDYKKKTHVSGRDNYGNEVRSANRPFNGANNLKKEIERDEAEIAQLKKIVSSTEGELDSLGVKLAEVSEKSKEVNKQSGGGGGGGGKGIADIYKQFNKEKKELANQLREQAITQEEYNKELDKLNQKYWENAAATGQLSIDKILAKMEKGKTLTAMEKWYKELKEAAEEAGQRILLEGLAEEVSKGIADAIDEEIKKIEAEEQKFIDKAVDQIQGDAYAHNRATPTKGKRDTLFDYKKSKSDMMKEQVGIDTTFATELEEAIEDIKSHYEDITNASDDVIKKIDEMTKEMNKAKHEAKSLEEAMKYVQIVEDLKKARKEIADIATNGFKNLAQSADRLVKGAESIRDVFEDTDSTGWEKFIAIYNEVIQAAESIISIIDTIKKLHELTQSIDDIKIARQEALNTLLANELALRQAIANLQKSQIKDMEKMTKNTLLEQFAIQRAASAKATEAVANATASGAKEPFPYNLAAIAGGVAAVITAIKLAKFANGGIVGGKSYTGDNNLARVNSGEMILNKSQQGTLWSLINGKGGQRGQVEFKIRGADLVGTLNNYGRMVK